MNLEELEKIIEKIKKYDLIKYLNTDDILQWLSTLNKTQINNLLSLNIELTKYLKKNNKVLLDLLNSDYYIHDIELIAKCESEKISSFLVEVASDEDSLTSPYHINDMELIADAESIEMGEDLCYTATSKSSLNSSHHLKDMEAIFYTENEDTIDDEQFKETDEQFEEANNNFDTIELLEELDTPEVEVQQVELQEEIASIPKVEELQKEVETPIENEDTIDDEQYEETNENNMNVSNYTYYVPNYLPTFREICENHQSYICYKFCGDFEGWTNSLFLDYVKPRENTKEFIKSKNYEKDMNIIHNAEIYAAIHYLKRIANHPNSLTSPYHEIDMELTSKVEKMLRPFWDNSPDSFSYEPVFSRLFLIAIEEDSIKNSHHEQILKQDILYLENLIKNGFKLKDGRQLNTQLLRKFNQEWQQQKKVLKKIRDSAAKVGSGN